jgi:YihY family inner membrane protein
MDNDGAAPTPARGAPHSDDAPAARRVVGRLDAYQQRHRWVGLPLAVVYKFIDDQGTYLAALITYYGFVSLFPLLLLLVTILGFALRGDPGLQQQILHSALRDFPIIGDQLGQNIHSLHGSVPAVIIGVLGSLYGGLGVTQAGQHALDTVWAVPRAARPDTLRTLVRGLTLLVVVGTGLLATTMLSALTTGADAYGATVDVGLRVTATLLAVAVNTALFLAAFRILTTQDVAIDQIRTGAIVAAVAWQALQELGTYFLAHELKGTSATYGLFGIVLGLLAWIYLAALIVVFCAELNVVRAKHLWPRSLLTPFFTDNVDLTRADKSAYTSYAQAEQHKDFQTIDVTFPPPSTPPEQPHE